MPPPERGATDPQCTRRQHLHSPFPLRSARLLANVSMGFSSKPAGQGARRTDAAQSAHTVGQAAPAQVTLDRINSVLQAVGERAGGFGDAFFPGFVEQLACSLAIRIAFVAECVHAGANRPNSFPGIK